MSLACVKVEEGMASGRLPSETWRADWVNLLSFLLLTFTEP